MQGEYRGDFTRDTFDPAKHFSRVLMQQGRVLLDEDWNEQTAILLHYLRTLVTDINGSGWGPRLNAGFAIASKTGNAKEFTIGAGRYYVDGILCENSSLVAYIEQLDWPLKDEEKDLGKNLKYIVYLDVWERHITAFDDDSIREIALGGPDTSSRARIVWQVRVDNLNEKANSSLSDGLKNAAKKLVDGAGDADPNAYLRFLTAEVLQPTNKGTLRARATKKGKPDEPCAISPESHYRGLENHLYRVEIHRAGNAWDGKDKTSVDKAATFKWSRDNASIVFPIRSLTGNAALLDHLGRDSKSSLQVGDFVEVVDDHLILHGEPGVIRQIGSIDETEMSVTLKDGPGTLPAYAENSTLHPQLRRWDQRDDGLTQPGLVLTEAPDDADANWIELEDGIQIQFPKPAAGKSTTYTSGDYWLIPARVASGNVEWPTDVNGAVPQLPHGIEHRYALIGVITTGSTGDITAQDFRKLIP